MPRFDMLGLVTADMSEAIRFYNLLGWAFTLPEDDGPYTEITLDCGLRISLNKVEMIREIDGSWVEPQGQRMGAAFLCESPQAVDETYARILEAGFHGHKEPWDAFWGQRYAQVLDPDGNAVDLFAPL